MTNGGAKAGMGEGAGAVTPQPDWRNAATEPGAPFEAEPDDATMAAANGDRLEQTGLTTASVSSSRPHESTLTLTGSASYSFTAPP